MHVLTNCRIVGPQEVFRGTVTVKSGRICDVDTGISQVPGAVDLEGDHLIPCLVEIHTDNLEKHMQPRSARWPGLIALIAHDAEVAGVGITTVLDPVCIGVDRDQRPPPRLRGPYRGRPACRPKRRLPPRRTSAAFSLRAATS